MPHIFKQLSFRFKQYLYPNPNSALKKLKVGEQQDVYLSASIRDMRFNTNIKAHIGKYDEMSWGFCGTGPYTLALNILYTFTRDEQFSRTHASEFRSEFLEQIDSQKSYWMSSVMITDWISQKIKGEEIYG